MDYQQPESETRVEWLKNPSAGVAIMLVVVVGAFTLIEPAFISPANLATIARSLSYTGIIAVGMAFCLISGVIDLSVGSTAALSCVMFGRAMYFWNFSIGSAALLALGISLAIGLINSFVILKLRVTPFIATISMMFIARGLANYASNGYSIYPLPEPVLTIGYLKPLGVSVAFVVFLIVLTLGHVILTYTLFGLKTRATGSDREIAICTEVEVDRVNMINLLIASGLAGVAGVLIACLMNAGSPTVGSGWEFAAITACAIGGVSLFGYYGNMFGLFCGLALVQAINNGIVLIGVNPYLQNVVVGLLLLSAMYLDVKRRTYLNLDKI